MRPELRFAAGVVVVVAREALTYLVIRLTGGLPAEVALQAKAPILHTNRVA